MCSRGNRNFESDAEAAMFKPDPGTIQFFAKQISKQARPVGRNPLMRRRNFAKGRT